MYRIILILSFTISCHIFCGKIFCQKNDTAIFKTEEIKVLGNKIVTNIFNAPGKVQIIDKMKIENKNGESLSDVLQLAGATFVKSYGGNYSLNTISMNGLGSEHTLILLNGFKLNSNQNNQLDLSTISKDNIQSIEILNNGSSSVYGSEAIGGIVNIITIKNSDKNLHFNINGQVGSYEQRKIHSSVEKRFSKVNFLFNFSKESSINNYDYFFNNGEVKILKDREHSNYDLSDYSVNAGYNLSNNSEVKYFSSFSNIKRSIPGMETGSEPSKATQSDKNWNNILSYENIFSKNLLLKSNLNFQNNLSHYSDRVVTNSFYKNIVLSNSTQLNYLNKNLQVVTGFDVNYSTLKSNDLDSDIKRIQPGIFLVSEIDLNEHLKMFPSIRFDYISDIKKNVLSGKLGVNYKPAKKYNLNFKASAGNNFASPTFNELYWKSLGNKNLRPESSVNLDVGAIVKFNLFSENIFELTYSYIDAKDKIVWSPNSNALWTPKNIGKSVSNVIIAEANFKKQFKKNISAGFEFIYSFTKSTKKSSEFINDPTYNKQLFYIPEHIMKCNLSFSYKKTGLNLFYSYTGRRFTDFENKNYLTAVNLFEGNVFQKFQINEFVTQLKIEVNNIFNEDYQMISGYPMPLRNYKLVLSIEY